MSDGAGGPPDADGAIRDDVAMGDEEELKPGDGTATPPASSIVCVTPPSRCDGEEPTTPELCSPVSPAIDREDTVPMGSPERSIDPSRMPISSALGGVDLLRLLFPAAPSVVLETALDARSGNVERAASWILVTGIETIESDLSSSAAALGTLSEHHTATDDTATAETSPERADEDRDSAVEGEGREAAAEGAATPRTLSRASTLDFAAKLMRDTGEHLESGLPEGEGEAGPAGSLSRGGHSWIAAAFPDAAPETLEETIAACGGDKRAAVAMLLGEMPEAELVPHAEAWDSEEEEAPPIRRRGKRTGLGKRSRRAGKAPKPRRLTGGYARPGGASGVSSDARLRLDRTRSSQSLEWLWRVEPSEDVEERIRSALRHVREGADLALYSFQTMLQREQELRKDFFVFYHSYSFAALLYEVQASIARRLYKLPDDFPPLPRLLKKPFHGKPALDLLMEDFSSMTDRDHNSKFRELAISANLSLFAAGTEAPPLSTFSTGYSCVDLKFKELLESLLRVCGLSVGDAEDVSDAIVALGTECGLPCHHYGGSGAYGAPTSGSGHMLQIFIHKDYVDDLAYICKPFGVPVEGAGPVSTFLGGVDFTSSADPHNCQARIFMHPDVFMDSSKARVFHYCAVPELCSMADHEGSRGRLVRSLDRLLEPLFTNSKAFARTFEGIEGLL